MCALLEERGYRREQILQLTRNYVRRVLWHKRDNHGNLDTGPVIKPDGPSRAEVLRRTYWKRGWPAHKIDQRVSEILAAEAKARKARK